MAKQNENMTAIIDKVTSLTNMINHQIYHVQKQCMASGKHGEQASMSTLDCTETVEPNKLQR